MARVVSGAKVSRWLRWLKASAGLLLLLLAINGACYLWGPGRGHSTEWAPQALEAMPEREDVPDVKDYQAIIDEGHFGKDKPPPRPQLFGILGARALLGESPDKAKMHELGAKLPGDYVLVEIGADSVVLEKEDKRETLKLFGEPLCGGGQQAPPDGGSGAARNSPEPPAGLTRNQSASEGARTNEAPR